MKIREAIVLAGGLGTRLQNTIPGLPKCLAPIHDRPFLDYLLKHLQSQGIERFIFSLGCKSGLVQDHLDHSWSRLDKIYAIESSPLGTGGAIRFAASFAEQADILVVNGDTFFTFNMVQAANFHATTRATCTMLLKNMPDTGRFGRVQLDETGRVTGFAEKENHSKGLINAGVYLLNREQWQQFHFPESFSFEKDFLKQEVPDLKIMGQVQDVYFIDIGIPGDYTRACNEILPFQ